MDTREVLKGSLGEWRSGSMKISVHIISKAIPRLNLKINENPYRLPRISYV